MKIAVMGAGAVGCYYGGMLARAGHNVSLIGRAAHMDAVHRDGLRLQAADFDDRLAVEAGTDAALARGAGLLLFCVKSGDTEAAGEALRPHLAPEVQVLSLQNGVDNAARLQAVLGRPVAPAVVYVATEMAGAGHVRHHGRGELVIGPSPQAAGLVALFGAAGVAVHLSDNVDGALWGKLVLNCAYNALSAVSRLPYGPLMQADGAQDVVDDIVREVMAVAAAEGVKLPADVWEQVRRIPQTMPQQRSSTAQDLARGRRSEIDHLNGFVVRRGQALGVAVPANRLLHLLVRLLEKVPAAAG